MPQLITSVTWLGMYDALQVAEVRSGDCGGHTTGPFRPILRPWLWLPKYRMRSPENEPGAQSYRTDIVCRVTSGTSAVVAVMYRM
jgi:hypothetical protein